MEALQKLMMAWAPFLGSLVAVILIITGYRKWLEKRSQTSLPHSEVGPQLFGIVLVGAMIVWLILATPLKESTEGQLLSLIGILFTAAIALSSTTFLGNLLGGLMIRTLRKFVPGDFLAVGEHFGRVTELGLLHCEIQTIDRDVTTIPNLYLVTNPVKVILPSGTIISEEVSLGYEIDRVLVERTLVAAADSSGLEDSFFQIMKLGDFSVTYKVSGFLKDVSSLLSRKSKLRECILDCLHNSGIEIVSPTFMNQRVYDPSKSFMAEPRKVKEEEGQVIDKLVFDKANTAGSIEKLKNQVSRVEDEIKAIKEGDVKVHDENDQKRQIEILEERKKRIVEFIKQKG